MSSKTSTKFVKVKNEHSFAKNTTINKDKVSAYVRAKNRVAQASHMYVPPRLANFRTLVRKE